MDVAPVCERVSCNHVSEFGRRAQDHSRAKTEVLLDPVFDLSRELGEIRFLGPEYDVATLYIGLRVPQFQRYKECPEGLHLDLVVAHDVDAAEQRDNHGHDLKYICRANRDYQRFW